MSLQRNAKKAFYAAIPVVAILFIIVIPALWASRGPADVQPTVDPAAGSAPIEIQEISVVPHPVLPVSEVQTLDVVAKLFNPNARAGVEKYPLEFVLLDTQGGEITRVAKETYVLPGMVQYVAVLNVSFPLGVQLGQIELVRQPREDFIRLPADVALPQFSSFLHDREERITGGVARVVQTGIVRNTSTFDWQRVEVRAVALDSSGGVIGVGETFVGRLLVGEQREFTLEWPKSSQAINQVIAIPSTNIFREENVVEIIGDPSRLR
ncbi:MAG: hypothetical protein WEC84_00415 [Candidatus Andersenbacteria bacterium]